MMILEICLAFLMLVLIGSLIYAMVCTRPDIAQVVGVLSRFMSNLGKENLTYVKRVIRYLWGAFDYCVVYHGTDDGFC